MAGKKQPERKPVKDTLTLECVLTDQERLKYSKELGESLTKKARAEEMLKSFQTQAKADIASLDARINGLADKINTGKECRPVECLVILDFKAKEKFWTRQDTGEIAKTAPISEGELQENIDL